MFLQLFALRLVLDIYGWGQDNSLVSNKFIKR